jgi:hypothetical protein
MGKLDSLQWVNVDMQNTNSDPRLIVLPSTISRTLHIRLDARRRKLLQTLQGFRERQSMDALAKDVAKQLSIMSHGESCGNINHYRSA